MNIAYRKQKEPEEYKKRSYNWKTAIGLQAVDGLVLPKGIVKQQGVEGII
ncbi:MAG: hypothetical protein FWF67_07525 [Fibromonadales bacterium]|nr:hypothetical protein [Fibromonadales bacterium]